MSVSLEDSVVVAEDAGSSQGESVIHVAGTRDQEVSPNPRYIALEKLERRED